MHLVENQNDILKNIELLDSYLGRGNESEKEFALALIKKGTCFLAVKYNNSYKFYPSRFVGYKDNSMDSHLNNEYKDGKETNPAISNILRDKPVTNLELEKEYKKYCEELGFVANQKGSFGVERKYWEL